MLLAFSEREIINELVHSFFYGRAKIMIPWLITLMIFVTYSFHVVKLTVLFIQLD